MAFRKYSRLLELTGSPSTKYVLRIFYVPHAVGDSLDIKVKKAISLPSKSLLPSKGDNRRIGEIKSLHHSIMINA